VSIFLLQNGLYWWKIFRKSFPIVERLSATFRESFPSAENFPQKLSDCGKPFRNFPQHLPFYNETA